MVSQKSFTLLETGSIPIFSFLDNFCTALIVDEDMVTIDRALIVDEDMVTIDRALIVDEDMVTIDRENFNFC